MKLPAHKGALYLTHNDHRNNYQSAAAWCDDNERTAYADWRDDESMRRAIATDEIWVLQWYPSTPVGFCAVAAPTLDELLAFAIEAERK